MSIPDHLIFGKQTNLEAIARTVVILENTPDENFNIGSWTCGTVHCAAGLAARDPWFNKHGFYLDEYGVVSFKSPYDPLYYPNYHWQAVSAIFKIAAAEAEWLFSGSDYIPEYPEPEWDDEERSLLNTESNDAQNLLFRHIPKSAVIGRLKQVLELHKYEIRPETNLS